MKTQKPETFTRLVQTPTTPTAAVRVYEITLRLYTDRGGPLVARRQVATTGRVEEAAARLFRYERERYQRLFEQYGLMIEDYDIQAAHLVAEALVSDVAAPAVILTEPPPAERAAMLNGTWQEPAE